MKQKHEDEIFKLRVEIYKLNHENMWHKKHIKKLNETIREDRETLAFYADVRTHELNPHVDENGKFKLDAPIEHDKGDAARKRLGNDNIVSEKYKHTKVKIGEDWLILLRLTTLKRLEVRDGPNRVCVDDFEN